MAASNNHRLTVTVKPNSGHTLFRYTAKDIDGKVVRGAMEAADYDMLYTQLLAQGLYLQSATRRGAGRKPRTLRPQELSDLCRQLSTLLASGVSLVRALTIISQDEGISAGLRCLPQGNDGGVPCNDRPARPAPAERYRYYGRTAQAPACHAVHAGQDLYLAVL